MLRMHADGADRAEVQRAVVTQLSAYGVDPTDLRADRERLQDHRENRENWRIGVGAFADALDLTDAQRETLRETAHTAREGGAYPAEVRVAVLDQLHEFGYTDTEIRAALLDDRAAEVRSTVAEMRADGAFGVEVRAAVLDLLREYGAIPDERPDHRGPTPVRGPELGTR